MKHRQPGGAVDGFGTIALVTFKPGAHLTNMRTYPDLDVRFVADLITDRARDIADRYGVVGSGSTQEALDRDDVECRCSR